MKSTSPSDPWRPLYSTEAEKPRLEGRNASRQYAHVLRLIEASRGSLILTADVVKTLQHLAVEDIYSCGGFYRHCSVTIKGSPHRPPEPRYVDSFVDQMCERANGETEWNPVQMAAFLIWRLNWIHPFRGGNGRTARALGYLGFCVRSGQVLPGKVTFADLIDRRRSEYLEALRDADAAAGHHGGIDTSKMESLLDRLILEQIATRDTRP